MATPDFGAIASTTLKKYSKVMADNVTNGNVFYKWMKMKGFTKTDGGDELVEPLMYAVGNSGSFSGTDTFNISVPEGISDARYNWKFHYATVTMTIEEEVRNSGESKMLDLIKARTVQAELSMMNDLGDMVYGDGTGNLGKDILGLAAICDTDPTTGVLGSIDGAAYPFWRNYTNTSVGSFATNGLAALGTAVRAQTRGSDKPNLILAGNTVYGYIEAAANNRAQFNNPQLAELGFAALKFEGIDVIYDPQCPADRIYVLNTKYLTLKVHDVYNYKTTDFIKIPDQPAKVAQIITAHQLVCSCRKLQGVLSGITA